MYKFYHLTKIFPKLNKKVYNFIKVFTFKKVKLTKRLLGLIQTFL